MGRKNILDGELIQERIQELEAARSQCEREISAKKTAMYQIQNILAQVITKKTELTNKQTEYTNLQNFLNTLRGDISALSSSINDVITNLNLMGEGNLLSGIITNLGNRAMTAGKKMGEIDSINASIQEKLSKIASDLTKLAEQEANLKKDIERNEQVIANNQILIGNINAEISALIESY